MDSVPVATCQYSNFVALNDNEFITATSTDEPNSFQLYRYNTISNKWSPFLNLGADAYVCPDSIIAINTNNQKFLYCYNCSHSALLVIDLEKSEWKAIHNTPTTYPAYTPMLLFAIISYIYTLVMLLWLNMY